MEGQGVEVFGDRRGLVYNVHIEQTIYIWFGGGYVLDCNSRGKSCRPETPLIHRLGVESANSIALILPPLSSQLIFQFLGFLKGFAPFTNREVDQADCTEAVHQAKTSELIDQAGPE
jgi:hypothetical protein